MCRCHLHLDLLSVEKKYDLNNHSTSFLSSHISPHTPATHNRRLISWGPRVQPPRPLHSHPGMPTPSCEHLQLSLCSLQVPWIDACGPAWPSQYCRGLPRARSHRAQYSAGRRVLLARSPAAAGPAPWVQVWRPPTLLSPLICFTTHWHVMTCIAVLCGAAFQ